MSRIALSNTVRYNVRILATSLTTIFYKYHYCQVVSVCVIATISSLTC